MFRKNASSLFHPIIISLNIDVSDNLFVGLFEFVFTKSSLYFKETADATLVNDLKKEAFSGQRNQGLDWKNQGLDWKNQGLD